MKFWNIWQFFVVFPICQISFAKRNKNIEKTWIFQRVTIESDRSNLQNRSTTTALPKSESLSGNFHNLSEISQIAIENKIKSICVQSGLWAIFRSENYCDVGAILYTSGLPDDRACTNDDVNGTNPLYKSLRHVGNRKLTQSGISLYSGTFFTEEDLYFDGWRLNLNQPIKIRSFGFTGKDNWTLFEKTEFRGTPACALSLYNGNSTSYDAVVYSKDVNLTIGSVQRGCVHGSSEEDNEPLKSVYIFPSGEIQSSREKISEYDRMEARFQDLDSLHLKIITINQTSRDDQFIFTDGDELRFMKSQILHVEYRTHGKSNWTIFSGTNFNGRSRCIFASVATLPLRESGESAANIGPDDTNEDDDERTMSLRMGSIKRGCDMTESHREPRIFRNGVSSVEQVRKKSNQVNSFENPNRKIFFASFLIVLGFLLFIILLGISIVSYFYLRNYNI